MNATYTPPHALGKCPVCDTPVWEDDERTQDFVSGWNYHATCALMIPESTKRSGNDED